LVIVSHSFGLMDGDYSREPLARLFGSLALSDIAVDGFFVISGYLVTQSFESSHSVLSYLRKRVLRIYPGYCVAFLVSIFIVAPLTGGALSDITWIAAFNMLLLQMPSVPNVFNGLHFPVLNGAMWTIAYEFRCYLAVVVLGLLGLLRVRWIMPS